MGNETSACWNPKIEMMPKKDLGNLATQIAEVNGVEGLRFLILL